MQDLAPAKKYGLTIAAGLQQAVISGAGLRVRPVMMTAAAIIAGLLPILFGSGTGSEVMSRIAAPMVGGMVSAVFLTLFVLPVVYYLWRKHVTLSVHSHAAVRSSGEGL